MPSKTVSEKTHIGDDSPLRTRTLGERMQINQPDSIGKEENNTGGQCTDGIGSRLGRNAILIEMEGLMDVLEAAQQALADRANNA